MATSEFRINVNSTETVSALLYPASKDNRIGVTIVLGHGAGANQLNGFMRMCATGLATRGFDAMTFNFLYSEQKRRLPDSKERLEACYRAVIEAALHNRKLKKNRLVIGGKSMGGRIASQVAAEDGDNISGLVFLGYPLHPPGRPDKPRSEHLKNIHAPMLFVQGSRDAFGTEKEIRDVIKKLPLRATVFAIGGGDHSFRVPKNAAVSQQQVYESVMDEIAKWVDAWAATVSDSRAATEYS
jgi:uncharacterized protein